MEEERTCSVCGCELEEDDHGMCKSCMASIILCDDIEPTIEDFEW